MGRQDQSERVFLRVGREPVYNNFVGVEEKGQLGISVCREVGQL